jgi:hypothetical protein
MVTRSDWATNLDEDHLRKENMAHILKKDTWQNEDGQVKQSDNGLPKDWKKGKLLGRKGMEVSDLQAKEWGLTTKAKAPTENKAK